MSLWILDTDCLTLWQNEHPVMNAAQLFVESSRRQIQITVELISPDDVTPLEIQEAGEDLGSILGRALETKIRIERIISSLEELQ